LAGSGENGRISDLPEPKSGATLVAKDSYLKTSQLTLNRKADKLMDFVISMDLYLTYSRVFQKQVLLKSSCGFDQISVPKSRQPQLQLDLNSRIQYKRN